METFAFATINCRPKNIAKYPHLLPSGKTAFETKYHELKKTKKFFITLLKLAFSDIIINGY